MSFSLIFAWIITVGLVFNLFLGIFSGLDYFYAAILGSFTTLSAWACHMMILSMQKAKKFNEDNKLTKDNYNYKKEADSLPEIIFWYFFTVLWLVSWIFALLYVKKAYAFEKEKIEKKDDPVFQAKLAQQKKEQQEFYEEQRRRYPNRSGGYRLFHGKG